MISNEILGKGGCVQLNSLFWQLVYIQITCMKCAYNLYNSHTSNSMVLWPHFKFYGVMATLQILWCYGHTSNSMVLWPHFKFCGIMVTLQILWCYGHTSNSVVLWLHFKFYGVMATHQIQWCYDMIIGATHFCNITVYVRNTSVRSMF